MCCLFRAVILNRDVRISDVTQAKAVRFSHVMCNNFITSDLCMNENSIYLLHYLHVDASIDNQANDNRLLAYGARLT